MSDTTVRKLQSVTSSNIPLPERVAGQIEELIRERELKTGEKLPNEFDMAQQLHVGRGTIREAVKILVSRNVVEIRRGCGTFVCEHPGVVDDPLGFAFIKDKGKLALDLCEIRTIIEPEIAALAAQRATPEQIRQIHQAAEEVEELCNRGERHIDKDIRFHELIAECTHNQVVPNIIPVIQSGIALFIDLTDASLANQTIIDHREILLAIEAHNPDAARKAMIGHLKTNRDKIKMILANQKES